MADQSWQKSTFSGDTANCIYLADVSGDGIWIRESDAPGTIISISPDVLRALLLGVKAGEFDHLTA